MTANPDQLVLELPHRPALGAEDFLVSQSNQAAADMIDRWPDWPHSALIVVAPAGAGKTHLGNVWRLKSGGAQCAANGLRKTDVPTLTGGVLVEDLHAGIGDELALFQLLNLARERRISLLLTSRVPPGGLEVRLPDLSSRLRAIPVVTISLPDQALLRAVLIKQFADRQLAVEPHVINYLALRMDRSMEAAVALVTALDRASLASHRKVTRALAAQVLAQQASA